MILLHGWLGSWALWRETIEILGEHFKLYALDFFGFGDSLDRSADFSVTNYVDLVYQFMERLGIVKAPLVGHSMGGSVSLGVASRYPEKVVKVIVIGSPIQGSSLNIFLKLSGNKAIANLLFTVPPLLQGFIFGITQFAAQDGRKLHRMVSEDSSKVSADSFFQSIGTLHKTDLTGELPDLAMPILGIYGRKDIIVHPNQGRVLVKHAPTAALQEFERSGHFPMLDEPTRFHDSVKDFLYNG